MDRGRVGQSADLPTGQTGFLPLSASLSPDCACDSTSPASRMLCRKDDAEDRPAPRPATPTSLDWAVLLPPVSVVESAAWDGQSGGMIIL